MLTHVTLRPNKKISVFRVNMDGSSCIEPVLSLDKWVLPKDHNAVTQVRPEPAVPWSRVKHSTTEPLCSLFRVMGLKILGRIGTLIIFLFTFFFWKEYNFMHFERHFTFQNA